MFYYTRKEILMESVDDSMLLSSCLMLMSLLLTMKMYHDLNGSSSPMLHQSLLMVDMFWLSMLMMRMLTDSSLWLLIFYLTNDYYSLLA